MAACTDRTLAIYLFIVCSTIAVTNVSTTDFTWREWWKPTVIYQIYPRSFMDSDGDGVGDLQGIISRLEYFPEICVDSIWLSPIYESPMADFGYDVSDFKNIDPIFGTLDDFDAMIIKMHQLGLKLIMDFVPNHSSDKHDWFLESMKSKDASNEYRDFYVWKDPKEGCNDPVTDEPENCLPNNWVSVFSGSRVQEEMDSVLRFWFDRGVDGMRVDAIRHMYEDESYADEPVNPDYTPPPDEDKPQYDSLLHTMTADLPELHDVIEGWRSEIFEKYSTEPNYRFMVTETYDTPSKLVLYYGTEENPQADYPFNFQLIMLTEDTLSGTEVHRLVDDWMVSTPQGKWPNWVVGNHDNNRIGDKLGYQYKRAANILNLLLPGTPTTYYGEEIGMEDIWVSYNDTQDPYAKNNPCCWEEYTRDPERSPMQWDATENSGFSTANKTWLPVNEKYLLGLNVEDQRKDPRSALNMYKKLTELRKIAPALQTNNLTYLIVNEQIFSFLRIPNEKDASHNSYLITINFSNEPSTDDYASNVNNRNLAFVGNVGAITVSSDMDRNGRLVDLTSVDLKPGEALVIETMTVPSSARRHTFLNLTLIAALILVAYYFTN
ncbi:maltase A3-like [Amphiura filiformis]|uniref:maltase A3-like n=1 Tax=Amphiura filiformis TaxID=82378 RepID=UPI003B2171DA